MTVTRGDIERGLDSVGLSNDSHVIVHSSYRSFGGVEGGPLAVVRSLVEAFGTVMMPASTWESTAIWDESGLFDGNAYRPEAPTNNTATPFAYDTPIDHGIGVIPETFRTSYPVVRSSHPLQSFVAYGELAGDLCGAEEDRQDVEPIRRLMEADGEVLLAGVTHTTSTPVHLAEHLAGRRRFVRHALTSEGVTSVLTSGDSTGFEDLQPHVAHLERQAAVGKATLRCYRLRPYVEAARALFERAPAALLCDCERCRATLETPLPA